MSESKHKLVNVVSQGKLVEGVSASRVTAKLQQQFNINEKQAACLLKMGFILKKNIALATAKHLSQNFLRLGVITTIQPVESAAAKQSNLTKGESTAKATPVNAETLNKVFSEDILRVPTSIAYKVALFSSAILSLFAPIVYMGLMVSLLVALFMYFGQLPSMLSDMSGGTFKLLLVIVPPFVICVMLIFMAKPLFSRRQRWRGFQLKPKQAPGLFSLVEIMCRRINVPVPTAIYVDNCVNASAGSVNGLFSLLRGELVLTVGLPLVTGLNARQLVGVLAHEFGHFAQPSAMFTYYFINGVNHWFADRIFFPDPWDERLEQWENDTDNFYGIFIAVKLAQWGISVTRMIFKILFLINLRVTSYMSRQMEYDADRYEAFIAGSDSFKLAAIKLRILYEAEKLVEHNNVLAWSQSKLLKDVPDAIAKQSLQLDEKTLQRVEAEMEDSDSKWWDSHPPDNDRVKNAESHQYKPVFNASYPADRFFSNIAELCAAVTLYEYRANGLQEAEKYIVENKQVLEVKETHEKTNKVLETYFNETFLSHRMMYLTKTSDAELAALDLQKSIDWLRQNLMKYAESQQSYEAALRRHKDVALGKCYLNAGIDISPADFHFANMDMDQIEKLANKEFATIQSHRKYLASVDAIFYQRMCLAIKKMPADKQQRSVTLLKTLISISQLKESSSNVEQLMYIIDCILGYEPDEEEDDLDATIKQQIKYCVHDLKLLLSGTAKVIDLVDASQGRTIKDFVISWTGELPPDFLKLPPWELIEFCGRTLGAIHYQYVWLFGELVALCEEQEKLSGIQPIKLVILPKQGL